MHAHKQIWILLDKGQGQASAASSQTGHALPLLFAPQRRAGLDLCELEIEHALEGDAVRGQDFEKVVPTVPHDLFHGRIGEDVEEQREDAACSLQGENVEYENVLGVGGADAHEGEHAARSTEALSLAVEEEEGGPCEDAGGIDDGGYVGAVGVSGQVLGHGLITRSGQRSSISIT